MDVRVLSSCKYYTNWYTKALQLHKRENNTILSDLIDRKQKKEGRK